MSALDVANLHVGDFISISGIIYAGRDAALPKLVKIAEEGRLNEIGVNLEGQVIFHTAVSIAGVGPTSSNKLEIENSIVPLSKAGVRLHLGKGAIHMETVEYLSKIGSVYAVIPPVTALLGSKIHEKKVAAFPELGMEALYVLRVVGFTAVIAAAHGRSIY
jgi:fumarate hydratase subunit beta